MIPFLKVLNKETYLKVKTNLNQQNSFDKISKSFIVFDAWINFSTTTT